MTAKEALREFVDELSNEEAEAWLSIKDSRLINWLQNESPKVSTEELLQLPAILRHLVIRYSAQFYTTEDAEFDLAENKLWDAVSAEALEHIDD